MKKLICMALAALLILSAVSAFAEGAADGASTGDYAWLDDYSDDELRALDDEIQKRLAAGSDEPADSGDASEAAANLLGLLLGGNAGAAPDVEPVALEVGEKVVTDTAEFEVVSLALSPIERGKASGWMTITGPSSEGKFLVDADCCVLTIVYRVKNTSTKSKWYWPTNMLVHVKWDDYEFEKLDAKPYGDLQSTQTKEYIAVVEIPNEIAEKGYEDLSIEIGFKDSFESFSDMRYADHRFLLPPLEYTREVEVPVVGGGAIGGTGNNPLSEYKDAETVKAVQQALNDAGYNCGTPDGAAGKNTKKAISDYQTAKGLTVTGTVTHELLVSLGLAD